MEEDLTIPVDLAKNSNVTEGEKLKDFVHKHFGDVTGVNFIEESSSYGHRSSTKKDKQPRNKTLSTLKQGAVFSGKILSFGCSLCKDNCTFSPNDLLKHFQALHKGTLPTYPCDLCDFFTNEFPALQRHRIEHRNTLVTCELCNDDVQYSLLLLTRHYIMCHSLNGQFNCDWCEFTTVDAGTFVQHIHHHNECHWKCSQCRYISLNEDDHHKHTEAHSGTFPFTCQICGYGASRSEFLKKHTAAVHKMEVDRRNASAEDGGAPANAPASLKLLPKKNGESHEAQKLSKLNSFSGTTLTKNGRLLKPETSSEETHLLVDGTLRKDNKNWSKVSHTKEQSSAIMLQEYENFSSMDAGNNANTNGLTVFMVKNKISLPPNCTTKVVGFKLVDGKKHLVLKVIQTAKQELLTRNHLSVEASASNPAVTEDSTELGELYESRNTASHCFAVSPRSASSFQMDQDDIIAVKVKIEEEETSVCSFSPIPNLDNAEEQPNSLLNGMFTHPDTFHPITNELEDGSKQSNPNECTDLERNILDANCFSVMSNSDKTSLNCSTVSHTTIVCASKGSDLISPSKVGQETLFSQPVFTKTEGKSITVNELPVAIDNKKNSDREKGYSVFNSRENNDSCPQTSPRRSDVVRTEIKPHNGLTPPPQLLNSVSCSKNATDIDKYVQSSPNQEVFTFHNYSKEIFSTSSNSAQNLNNESEHSADKGSVCILGEMQFPDSAEDDMDIDDCVAGADDLMDGENPDSVLQDFNIIKIEEECIPISPKPKEKKNDTTSFGTFVEEHSDAIIYQQLNKERTKLTGANNESLKQTKTTLRIIQLPDSKQPVLLRGTDKHFSTPVQVKVTPGFKLISNSENPQINVSYMKPGLERSLNSTGVTQNRRRDIPSAKSGLEDKGATLIPAVQPGSTVMSNHYVIKSTGFKGPVVRSSTPHHTPTEKTAKTQPTCFLVQRSIPFVQAPGTPQLKLTNTQLSVNSQPVLAMPVNTADQPKTVQSGRQAIFLRYISPPKSGLILNNPEAEIRAQCNQTSESSGGKVIFKIVTPTGSRLTNGDQNSKDQPLFLAAKPQTQCFLVSSNKTNATTYNGVKKLFHIQNASQNDFQDLCISASQMNVNVQSSKVEKPVLAPRSIRPPSQRKRCRKTSFDELPAMAHKSKRISNRVPQEISILWKPVAKEVERTLRLFPVTSEQQIKCPRRHQPVVVLNHPDADIPEVTNIMKVVTRYKGAVTKVALSKKTIQALSELDTQEQNSRTKGPWSDSDELRPRPLQSLVRERFLLKMKLRKKSKKKYEVVKTLSGCKQSSVFECWFCGRLFNSQEDWIGHGQRHLMEATRDWNKLF